MTDGKGDFTPKGWHTVTPRIVALDAKAFVEFLKEVFAAEGEYVDERPAIISIGDSMIMISEAGVREPSSTFLYVYVSDADDTYERAIERGALGLEQPAVTPYGDRRCMIEDAWGNTWQIATYLGKD